MSATEYQLGWTLIFMISALVIVLLKADDQ